MFILEKTFHCYLDDLWLLDLLIRLKIPYLKIYELLLTFKMLKLDSLLDSLKFHLDYLQSTGNYLGNLSNFSDLHSMDILLLVIIIIISYYWNLRGSLVS